MSALEARHGVFAEVFRRHAAGATDAVALLRALIAEVRPGDADRNLRALIETLRACDEDRAAVRTAVLEVLSRKPTRYFTDAGILPGSGFFTELSRRISHKLLPCIDDESELAGAIARIYQDPRDHVWLSRLPEETRRSFWEALGIDPGSDQGRLETIRFALLDATQILGCRIGAMGLEPELLRVLPQLDRFASPFTALTAETQRFSEALRTGPDARPETAEDERQLLVLVDQCEDVLRRARSAALTRGSSLHLSYLLVRLDQSLRRLRQIARLLGARFAPDPQTAIREAWVELSAEAALGVMRRNSVREHLSGLVRLLAFNVTQNAGRTGEHYIANGRAEYFGMWGSAAKAGLVIAAMALFKMLAGKLALAPLAHAFVYSMNYSLGFMLVHVLNGTIATKQPAMTAATIAGAVSQIRGRMAELERLADLVTDTVRSQMAAILGNVLIACPVAIVIGLALAGAGGTHPVSAEKAHHLLHELDPVASLAIPHAAIAGVYLFLAGLISGYFDNRAACSRIGDRVAALPWLRRIVGPERAARLGGYVDGHLGGLAGNFFFGIMLGSTATLGFLLGLPLDIRHVAFAAANFGYALVALDFILEPAALFLSLAGIAVIGLVNLSVSFSLALWVALKSRGVQFRRTGALLRVLGRRLAADPRAFLLPPRAGPVS